MKRTGSTVELIDVCGTRGMYWVLFWIIKISDLEWRGFMLSVLNSINSLVEISVADCKDGLTGLTRNSLKPATLVDSSIFCAEWISLVVLVTSLSVLWLPARFSSGRSNKFDFSFTPLRIAFSVKMSWANLTRIPLANSCSSNRNFFCFKQRLAKFCRSNSSRNKVAIFSSRIFF